MPQNDAPDTAARPAPPRRWLLPLRLVYTLYAASVFTTLAVASLPLLVMLPTLSARRRLTRWVGRSILTLMGMPVRVHLCGPLPEPCIVVANHGSYLDGVVLMATLPPRFGFVIKREMSSVPLAGLLLRRIGSHFVSRDHRAGSARDALRLMRTATRGVSMAFFPEGTFGPEPGLLRFHTGAFAAAERAGTPIIPMVLRGTRYCLPPETFLARPGRIEVQMLAPMLPRQQERPDGAAALRDAARAAILAALNDGARAAAERG
jgi:1-acyl-sn-glycerol-3-phosphate acyltransferase